MAAPFFVSSAGVRHYWRDNPDGSVSIDSFQDVDAVLDRNKAMANENDGYTPSRDLRRVASIPLLLVQKWRDEEGWDAFDPACADRLARKLNSSEFLYLRTAPGHLGVSNGVMR